MDSLGYYGFLARNLPPRRLARAAGLRLWRQTSLPLLPLPAEITPAGLLRSFGVEAEADLAGRLAEPLEGPLGFRSPSAARESARWISQRLPAAAQAAVALAERSLSGRIVVFGREVTLPRTGAEVPLASGGWSGIDWEVDPIVTGEKPPLVRRADGGGGRLRGAAGRGAGADEGGSTGGTGASRQPLGRGARAPNDGARIPGGRDPKRQWIVGRLEEVVHLASGALLLPDDPDRAEAFVDAALDRMVDLAQAPRGIQWTCTMEVALRASNMAIALRLLAGHRRLVDRADALREILRFLALHLAWIPRHLEDTGVVANNHLVANWVGMLAASALLPRLPGAHLAARRASKGLADELMAQTLADGFGFEGSVPYHGLAVELFLLGDLFAATAGLPLPEPVRRRLALAIAATAELRDARGLAPRIGDDDSGRAIPFTRRDSLDLGWLAALGAAHLGGQALAPAAPASEAALLGSQDPASTPPIEQIWLLGPPKERGPRRGGQRSGRLAEPPLPPSAFRERAGDLPVQGKLPTQAPGRPRKPHRDSALHHGGIYLLRSRRLSVAIACGPNGTGGLGTHGHNDKLSVEVCVDGILVVADPGSGSYSGDPTLRNQLRGTAAHSTVQLDGAEQQPLPLGRLFALPDHARPRCVGFESSPTRARFVGEHRGYLRLGAIHRRVVALDRADESIEIVDRLTAPGGPASATGERLLRTQGPQGGAPAPLGLLRLAAPDTHRAQCRFLIPAEAGPPRIREGGQGGWVVEIGAEGDATPVALLIPEPGSPLPTLEPAWYAKGYDQVEAATAVVIEKEGALPLVFRTTIRPCRPASGADRSESSRPEEKIVSPRPFG